MILCLLLFTLKANGQGDSDQKILDENFLDNTLLERVIDQTNEEVVDLYLNNTESKYNIHHITREELRSLGFLNENQISNFLDYRGKFGPFRSIYELQVIDGFDKNIIIQFLMVLTSFRQEYNEKPRVKQTLAIGSMRLLQQKQGFQKDSTGQKKFSGDAQKIFLRYALNFKNKFSVGLVAEKDEGEVLMFQPKDGKYFFDHISAYLSVNNLGIIKKLTIGDFRIQTGQGLVFGQAFAFGKGTETITSVRKSNINIRPVSSSYEYKDFSGIGATLGMGKVDVNLFGSSVSRDATLHLQESQIPERYVSSLNQSGLHRTENERSRENSLQERNLGLNINFNNKNENLNIGLNYLYTHFSLPIYPQEQLSNQYRFRGKVNMNASTYFNYYLRSTHFFSEIATSKSYGIGLVSGLIHQVSESVFLSVLYRRLDRDYHSFHGNVFSEGSSPINENGLYLGLRISPLKNFRLSLYHDTFSHPWIKHQEQKLSKGSDWLAFLEYEKYRSIYAYFRCNYTNSNVSNNVEKLPTDHYEKYNKLNLILYGNIPVTRNFKIYQRIQFVQSHQSYGKDFGYLMATGMDYQIKKLGISSSFSIFDAIEYENRLYFYQISIPHGYLHPFFFNQGSNLNIRLKYQLNSSISIWSNFNQTFYLNIDKIGNGDDSIDSNKKSMVSLEVIININ